MATDWEDCPLFAPADADIPHVTAETSADHSSAISALSHLLYDEETPLEASELLRDEGNRHFKRTSKHGRRTAILKYTEAIAAAQGDARALAPAYLNRGIAHYKLGNFGKALADAKLTLQYDPQNVKAYFRAVQAAMELRRYAAVVELSSKAMEFLQCDAPEWKLFREQLEKATVRLDQEKKSEKEAYQRQLREKQRKRKIEQVWKSRGVTMGAPMFAQQTGQEAFVLDAKTGSCVWRALLVYPGEVLGGVDHSDTLETVDESASMADIISAVFSPGVRMGWDTNAVYALPEMLEVRYRRAWTIPVEEVDPEHEILGSEIESHHLGEWVAVDGQETLMDLVKRRDYITPHYPVLYVVPKGAKLRE